MRLTQLYKVLQDTNTTDEFRLFFPAISSTISRASSSNVHFMTEVKFLPIAPRVTIETLALSRFKATEPVA